MLGDQGEAIAAGMPDPSVSPLLGGFISSVCMPETGTETRVWGTYARFLCLPALRDGMRQATSPLVTLYSYAEWAQPMQL